MERLIHGGIYLARLDPAKGAEIGKLRPVALLSASEILEIDSPLLFVCPLSSRSEPGYASLQCRLAAARRPEGCEFRVGGALPRHQPYPTLRPPGSLD